MPKITAQIPWNITQAKSGLWVGHSPLLKLSAQGKTKEELRARIGETLNLLFTDLVESGDLKPFLFAHGWEPVTDDEEYPAQLVIEEMLEDIPVSLKEVDERGFAAAAC